MNDVMEHTQFIVNLLALPIVLGILDYLISRLPFIVLLKPVNTPENADCATDSDKDTNEQPSNERMGNKIVDDMEHDCKDNRNTNNHYCYDKYCFPVTRHIIIPLIYRVFDKFMWFCFGRIIGGRKQYVNQDLPYKE